MKNIVRTTMAGIAGGVAFAGIAFLTFGLLSGSRPGQTGLLFNPDTQSAKVIAVWKTIQPLPLITTHPPLILIGFIAFGVIFAFLFRSIQAAWPPKRWSRIWRLALLIWIATLFFEFMGPLNVLRESPSVQWIELVFWAGCSLAEAAIIVSTSSRANSSSTSV